MTYAECLARLAACDPMVRGERLSTQRIAFNIMLRTRLWFRMCGDAQITVFWHEGVPLNPEDVRRHAFPLRRAREERRDAREHLGRAITNRRNHLYGVVMPLSRVPPPDLFRERLRAVREQRGFSQDEMAKRAGLQASAVSHFETGTRKPSFDNLRRLADALEITTDYLVGRADEPTGHAAPMLWAERALVQFHVGAALLGFFSDLAILVRKTPAPCPFCAQEVDADPISVTCVMCGAYGPEGTFDDVQMWNRVAIPAAFARLKDRT